MESLFAKIREMQTNWDSMRNSFQTNGTPIRSGMKVVREAVENSYNEAIVTAHGVEENVDNLTSRIDQFRIHNAAIANYCLVHPSTAIFGSAGAIAIPSYLGFGVRGMMLGAVGAASFTTLFVGSLLYAQRSHHVTKRD